MAKHTTQHSSFISRLIAAHHRRQALEALRTGQLRACIRLARYNAHMATARRWAVCHD